MCGDKVTKLHRHKGTEFLNVEEVGNPGSAVGSVRMNRRIGESAKWRVGRRYGKRQGERPRCQVSGVSREIKLEFTALACLESSTDIPVCVLVAKRKCSPRITRIITNNS